MTVGNILHLVKYLGLYSLITVLWKEKKIPSSQLGIFLRLFYCDALNQTIYSLKLKVS